MCRPTYKKIFKLLSRKGSLLLNVSVFIRIHLLVSLSKKVTVSSHGTAKILLFTVSHPSGGTLSLIRIILLLF